MKKSLLLLLLLPLIAAPAFAQESRQDVSVSASALFPPYIAGDGVNLRNNPGRGVLLSYRYLLTPSNGLEVNYQYAQEKFNYHTSVDKQSIHFRFQEASGEFVHSFTFRNWNPFVEAGPAGFIFRPIDDTGTQDTLATGTTEVGFAYGGGFAYEISPSFDIRAEYRGLVFKTPTFGNTDFNTGRYYNVSDPVVGIAYHF